MAVERLLDVEVPPRATWIRMMLCELTRMASHLLFQATNGMDIGAVSMMLYGWREREEVLRYPRVRHRPADEPQLHPPGRCRGRPARRLAGAHARRVRHRRARASPTTTSCSRRTRSGCERTVGLGVITTEECLALSITGPILRSTGFAWDLRKAQPYLAYDEVDFDVIYTEQRRRLRPLPHPALRDPRVDQDRAPVRGEDAARATTACRTRSSRRRRAPASTSRWKRSSTTSSSSPKASRSPPGETYVAIESPRGEIGCYMVSDGSGKPVRMHIRGPSFYNLQSIDPMGTDSLVADAVAIVSSIDPIMGEVDR